ncbi:MAG TPA: WG repeat-containing protein [Cytophagaceae bacterium]
MRTTTFIISCMLLLALYSCQQSVENESEESDLTELDSDEVSMLFAVTDAGDLELGARVSYVDSDGNTVIPFDKYAYFGTDTLMYYANVIDNTSGKPVAINRDGEKLFDLVLIDNGPDPFNEGLTRVSIDGKIGYANVYGEVVIPCIYAAAKWFENGVAEVALEATERKVGEHTIVESDQWFKIDKLGQRID